jgi:hypothetical protein
MHNSMTLGFARRVQTKSSFCSQKICHKSSWTHIFPLLLQLFPWYRKDRAASRGQVHLPLPSSALRCLTNSSVTEDLHQQSNTSDYQNTSKNRMHLDPRQYAPVWFSRSCITQLGSKISNQSKAHVCMNNSFECQT